MIKKSGSALWRRWARDARAVGPLIALLRNSDSDVRQAATGALGKIDPYWPQSEAAIRQLPDFIAVLRDSDNKGLQDEISLIVPRIAENYPSPASFFQALRPWNVGADFISVVLHQIFSKHLAVQLTQAFWAGLALLVNPWFISLSVIPGFALWLVFFCIAKERLNAKLTLVFGLPFGVVFHGLLIGALWLAFTAVIALLRGLPALTVSMVVAMLFLQASAWSLGWLLIMSQSWLLAKRSAHRFVCPTCATRRFYDTPGLAPLVRWTGRVLAKEINRKHDDFADYFVCNNCQGEAKIKEIKQVVGVLGGEAPIQTVPGEWSVSLWDEAKQQSSNADIDRLVIRKGGVTHYDLAVNAVINTLKGDASRPLKWCEQIPVLVEANLDLPPGALAMLKDNFKEVRTL